MLNVTTEPAKILDNLTKEFKKLQKEAQPTEKAFNNAFNARKAIWDRMKAVLDKIQKGGYYKAKYRTFEQYCQQELGYSRSYVHRLRKTIKLNDQLALENVAQNEIGQQNQEPLPERQARELAVVPETERAEVLEDAKKGNGKLSARKIRESATKRKEKDEIPKDREGCPIPSPAIPIWIRRDEVKPRLAFLAELRQWADDMQGSGDPLYAEIVFSALKLDIEAVESRLKLAVPYVVCSQCQGQAPQTCPMCKGRGMISKYRYHSIPATPVEMKEMRKKLAAGSS
jgi:hypothetical protein